MPVISSKAFVRTSDSYLWVVRPSEATLIERPRYGADASISHFISAVCSSFEIALGWNSSSIHFAAAVSYAALSPESEPPLLHAESTRVPASTGRRTSLALFPSTIYFLPPKATQVSGSNYRHKFPCNNSIFYLTPLKDYCSKCYRNCATDIEHSFNQCDPHDHEKRR